MARRSKVDMATAGPLQQNKGIAPSCNAYHDWHGKKWPAAGLDQQATNQSQLQVDTWRKSTLNVNVTATIAASDMVCAT